MIIRVASELASQQVQHVAREVRENKLEVLRRQSLTNPGAALQLCRKGALLQEAQEHRFQHSHSEMPKNIGLGFRVSGLQ